MPKRIRTHTFGRRKRKVVVEEILGYVDPHEVYISPRSPTRPKKRHYTLLEVLIHEATHALAPEWTEARVGRFAHEMHRWLSRWGCRAKKKGATTQGR